MVFHCASRTPAATPRQPVAIRHTPYANSEGYQVSASNPGASRKPAAKGYETQNPRRATPTGGLQVEPPRGRLAGVSRFARFADGTLILPASGVVKPAKSTDDGRTVLIELLINHDITTA